MKLARCLLLVMTVCIFANAQQRGQTEAAAFSHVHSSHLPANARACSECHISPYIGGSSRITVDRAGQRVNGRYIGATGEGILHKINGETENRDLPLQGLRVSLTLFGDGYVEAIEDSEFEAISRAQVEESNGTIHGEVTYVSPIESASKSVGRFGWKSQHATLLDASADALRSELGIPNRIFGSDSPNIKVSQGESQAHDRPDELDKLVDFIRNTEPVSPDPERSATEWAKAGSQIFDRIGCSICHVRTLKTAPTGTRLFADRVPVTQRMGDKEIHPFSDYLLHDIGTGDGIIQNLLRSDYRESSAQKFRTAPLWGVRFRTWMMHDGKSITYHQAIMRHRGEAAAVVDKYSDLSPIEKEQLRQFLDSL